jgi:transposase
MIYVGMDISSKSFVVHAINDKKRVVFKGEVPPSKQGLSKMMAALGNDTKLVVFEAGNQLKWIALWFKRRKDVHLHVVHPNEIKWINQSSGKTDKIDARKLAQLARGDLLPRKVHIVDGHIRELRELISARRTLQSKRVALINSLRGYALQEGKKLPEKFFSRADWYEALTKKRLSAPLQLIVQCFRESIDQLVESEAELTKRILCIKDDRLQLLETTPGIGELSSRVLLSALDDARRFDNRKTVAKYGALTPTIYQSGNETHLGHINYNGRHEIRRVLLQCAHTAVRMKNPAAAPIVEFYDRLMKKSGKKIAVVAVARKLLTIAYGILRSGTPYDPAKLRPEQGQTGPKIYRLKKGAQPRKRRRSPKVERPQGRKKTSGAKVVWQF